MSTTININIDDPALLDVITNGTDQEVIDALLGVKTIVVNDLAGEWDRFYEAGMTGSDADVIAALLALACACPEVSAWTKRTCGASASKLAAAYLAAEDAISINLLDDIGYEVVSFDDLDQRLDEARVERAVREAIDAIALENHAGADAVRRYYGIGCEEETLDAIGADEGITRQGAQRRRARGLARFERKIMRTASYLAVER